MVCLMQVTVIITIIFLIYCAATCSTSPNPSLGPSIYLSLCIQLNYRESNSNADVYDMIFTVFAAVKIKIWCLGYGTIGSGM
jgi:hypothetical protein